MSETIKMPAYGGQAVIEGVMMRGSRSVAIAMRSPSKEIVVHTEPLGGIYQSRLAKIPFLRGLVMLWDALGLGVRALTLSANTQTGEEEKIEGPALFLTVIISLAFSIGLFFLAPAAAGQWSESVLKLDTWLGNFVEGLVRLIFLVMYIWAVGQWADIRRVFAYHGAEHKTINAFEAGVELTPENVSKFSLEHPRCGTAFLLTLVIMSVLLFSMLGPMPVLWRFASRVIFLPLLAGLAYEFIRWTANHLKNPLVKLLVKPNLGLQHLATREPSLDMLEVAIAAFNTMRAEEERLVA
jgi:uncharacterized protein YqhQ